MNFESFDPIDGQPLHAQIRDWLLSELDNYPLEAKLPTDRKLASSLGVAPLTVKRVMGDLERDGYVVRQQGKGTFLASRERRVHPDGARADENGEIIIAYPNYFSYEYWARAHFAESMALKAGMGLVEFKMNQSTTYENLIQLVEKHERVRGVLICPIPGSIDRAAFDRLNALGVPTVIFAHCDYISLGENIFSVTADTMTGGYLKVEYLIKRGHQRIAYLANEPLNVDGGEGVRGMRQAMKDHGLPARNLVWMRSTIKPWESSALSGYDLLNSLQDRAPATALIVDSVAGAMGCIRYCHEQGISVPGEISLICGGPIKEPYKHYLYPSVTAIYSAYEDQIAQAFDVIQRPDAQTAKILRTTVVVEEGGSVADLTADTCNQPVSLDQ